MPQGKEDARSAKFSYLGREQTVPVADLGSEQSLEGVDGESYLEERPIECLLHVRISEIVLLNSSISKGLGINTVAPFFRH